MQALNELLIETLLGEAAAHANLTLFPLLGGEHAPPRYLTLDQALAEGRFRIEEVSQAGSVPTLRAINPGERPVLLLDGEELVGAKQNRVLNLSILVPAKTTLEIPVSCVEQGRWGYRSADFSASGSAHHASGRAYKTQSVSASLRSGGAASADQVGVWRDIAAKAERMQVQSATLAMADLYEGHRGGVQDYVKALPANTGQRGALFAIDGAVVGLDIFDSADTLAALLPKLVRSYALDAIETLGRPEHLPTPRQAAADFLAQVSAAQGEAFPALGLGEDLRLTGPALSGGALVLDAKVVHLCAFRSQDPAAQAGASSRMVRASRRGGHRGPQGT
jgi:hypothetical protein